MALHWEHIKGINGDNNGACYSFLTFPKTYGSDMTNNMSVSLKNTTTNNESTVNLGYLITSEALNQSISNPIKLSEIVGLYNGEELSGTTLLFSADNFKFRNSAKDKSYLTLTNTGMNVQGKIIASGIISNGSITAASSCTALYFNATSDKRAKENLKPFNSNALDIVSKFQTYTFNYKNNKEVSFGLIAQDLLDTKINDFSFIENENASGENNDYMSIRESKLVYLLIEAIKEQQVEINSLKEQIKNLNK